MHFLPNFFYGNRIELHQKHVLNSYKSILLTVVGDVLRVLIPGSLFRLIVSFSADVMFLQHIKAFEVTYFHSDK